MPDHVHMLAMGIEKDSDQVRAISFLRKHLRESLAPFEWQRPPYDHVLRDREQWREEYEKTAGYVFENPVRAGLVEHYADWPYSCAVVPGYPDMDVYRSDFWDVFWRIYYRKIEEQES